MRRSQWNDPFLIKCCVASDQKYMIIASKHMGSLSSDHRGAASHFNSRNTSEVRDAAQKKQQKNPYHHDRKIIKRNLIYLVLLKCFPGDCCRGVPRACRCVQRCWARLWEMFCRFSAARGCWRAVGNVFSLTCTLDCVSHSSGDSFAINIL